MLEIDAKQALRCKECVSISALVPIFLDLEEKVEDGGYAKILSRGRIPNSDLGWMASPVVQV